MHARGLAGGALGAWAVGLVGAAAGTAVALADVAVTKSPDGRYRLVAVQATAGEALAALADGADLDVEGGLIDPERTVDGTFQGSFERVLDRILAGQGRVVRFDAEGGAIVLADSPTDPAPAAVSLTPAPLPPPTPSMTAMAPRPAPNAPAPSTAAQGEMVTATLGRTVSILAPQNPAPAAPAPAAPTGSLQIGPDGKPVMDEAMQAQVAALNARAAAEAQALAAALRNSDAAMRETP